MCPLTFWLDSGVDWEEEGLKGYGVVMVVNGLVNCDAVVEGGVSELVVEGHVVIRRSLPSVVHTVNTTLHRRPGLTWTYTCDAIA